MPHWRWCLGLVGCCSEVGWVTCRAGYLDEVESCRAWMALHFTFSAQNRCLLLVHVACKDAGRGARGPIVSLKMVCRQLHQGASVKRADGQRGVTKYDESIGAVAGDDAHLLP